MCVTSVDHTVHAWAIVAFPMPQHACGKPSLSAAPDGPRSQRPGWDVSFLFGLVIKPVRVRTGHRHLLLPVRCVRLQEGTTPLLFHSELTFVVDGLHRELQSRWIGEFPY